MRELVVKGKMNNCWLLFYVFVLKQRTSQLTIFLESIMQLLKFIAYGKVNSVDSDFRQTFF